MEKWESPERGLSYILLTYRSGIQPLFPSTTYDSDAGWGCMLRVAQMFAANLLFRRLRWKYLDVLLLFLDNQQVPLSIQVLTNAAARLLGKKKEQWYSPSEAGCLLKEVLDGYLESHRVSICSDNCIFLDQIGTDRPHCIVLVMCRLGLSSPQKEYLPLVRKLMRTQFFAGVLGGRPKYAHFLVEHSPSNGKFRYLDPHRTLKVVADQGDLLRRLEEFHGRLQDIDEMSVDPSMCIAFEFAQPSLGDFWKTLQVLKQELKEGFFLYIDETTPQTEDLDIVALEDDYA